MDKRFFNTVGKRMRLLRRDLGLTQDEVVDALAQQGVHVGRTYMSVLESNDRIPSGEVLAGLARVLNTTTDFLLMLTDDPMRPEDRAEVEAITGGTGDDWLALGQQLRNVPPDRMRRVLGSFAMLLDALLGNSQEEPPPELAAQVLSLDPRGRGLVSAILSAAERGLVDDDDLAALEEDFRAFVKERRSKKAMISRQPSGRSSSGN